MTDLSPEELKKREKAIIIAYTLVFGMIIFVMVYLAVVTLTMESWSYSEELTGIFYEDEFGTSDPSDLDFPTEYNYKVMVGGTTTDGYTEIMLYSQVLPSTEWVLKREGYVDSDNNLYWQTYY